MFARFVAVLVVACWPVVTLAQALVERVPDDAIIYIGWQGSDNLGPGYAGSHLKAVLDASEVPQFINEFLPQVMQRIGQGDLDAKEGMALLSAIGGPLWRHRSAFYFGGLDFTNPGQPVPRMAIMCDAGAEAKGLADQLTAIIAKAPPAPVPVKVFTNGSLVALTVGQLSDSGLALLNAAAAPRAGALAQKAAFTSAIAQVHKQPVAIAYVDIEAAMKLVAEAIKQGPLAEQMHAKQMNGAQALRAFNALGLNGAKRLIITGGFDGVDWSNQAFLAAPAPRTGLLSLLDVKPLGDDVYQVIPRSATEAWAGQFDFSRLLTEIRNGTGNFDLNAQAQFDQGLLMVGQMIGLDIQKDLFQALGDQWVAYNDPHIGGTGMLGIAIVNRLRDPVKAEQSLSQLETMAGAAIKANMRDEKMSINFWQKKVGDLNIHYVGLPLVTPGWAIRDGNLYIALYPQVIVGAADHVAAKGKSILTNEAFMAARKRLGGEKATAFQFADLPQTAPGAYSSWMAITRLVGFGDMLGVQSPLFVLPPLGKIMPHLSPAAGAAWMDDAGWHSRDISAFPGSEALATDPVSSMMVAQPAMAISVMLPALNRAREQARGVSCTSNMRQIAVAIMMYAADNKGMCPPDLGALVATQNLPAQLFICPGGSRGLPDGFGDAAPERIAMWVNRNTDYIYIGAGLKTTDKPELIVLYEPRGQAHGRGGMNVLFLDGHTQFMPMQSAVAAITKQTGKAPRTEP